MALRHGPSLLTLRKGTVQTFKNKCLMKHLQINLEHKTNDQVWTKSTSWWVHKNLLWQMSRNKNLNGLGVSCATTASPEPSGHLGGWVMLGSAEKTLDDHHQRVDIPAYARTARDGLPQRRLEKDLNWIVPLIPQKTLSVKGLNWDLKLWRSWFEGLKGAK